MRPLADGKHLELHVVADADHFFQDLFADEVADAAAKFLRP